MSQQSKKPHRIKLKCRYDGEIRNVIVSADTDFLSLKKRLSTDHGFEVSLKYEDKDGDLVILNSQNDFDSLLLSESETVNVIVSEAVVLPLLNVSSRGSMRSHQGSATVTGSASIFPGSSMQQQPQQQLSRNHSSMAVFPSSQQTYNGSNQQLQTPLSNHRFPSIFDQPLEYQSNIRWKRGEVLGQGAFGIVTLGLNIDNGELMAVKQMTIDEVSSKELSTLENEINLLRNIRHPNIVRYIGTEISSSHLSIFLEYVPGGSLKALVDKFGSLEESVVRSYTRQLMLGLEYLHRYGVAHRDIKGANCLVGNDGVVKLADFGNSKSWRTSHPNGQHMSTSGDIKGTPCWMAPEVIRDQGSHINWKKADVWSLGCTTLEMTTGKAPWSQFNNSVTILYHIACQDTMPEYPPAASAELTTFLNTCLVRNPAGRPDTTSLLLHPFVSSMMPVSSLLWGTTSGPGMGSGAGVGGPLSTSGGGGGAFGSSPLPISSSGFYQQQSSFTVRPSTVSVAHHGRHWSSSKDTSSAAMGSITNEAGDTDALSQVPALMLINSPRREVATSLGLGSPRQQQTTGGNHGNRGGENPSSLSNASTPRLAALQRELSHHNGHSRNRSASGHDDDSVVSDVTMEMFNKGSSASNNQQYPQHEGHPYSSSSSSIANARVDDLHLHPRHLVGADPSLLLETSMGSLDDFGSLGPLNDSYSSRDRLTIDAGTAANVNREPDHGDSFYEGVSLASDDKESLQDIEELMFVGSPVTVQPVLTSSASAALVSATAEARARKHSGGDSTSSAQVVYLPSVVDSPTVAQRSRKHPGGGSGSKDRSSNGSGNGLLNSSGLNNGGTGSPVQHSSLLLSGNRSSPQQSISQSAEPDLLSIRGNLHQLQDVSLPATAGVSTSHGSTRQGGARQRTHSSSHVPPSRQSSQQAPQHHQPQQSSDVLISLDNLRITGSGASNVTASSRLLLGPDNNAAMRAPPRTGKLMSATAAVNNKKMLFDPTDDCMFDDDRLGISTANHNNNTSHSNRRRDMGSADSSFVVVTGNPLSPSQQQEASQLSSQYQSQQPYTIGSDLCSIIKFQKPLSLEEHTGAVTRLRAPRRARILLSSSVDGTIRIWGPSESESRAVLDVANFASDSSSSSKSPAFASAAADPKRSIKVLNCWAEDSFESIWACCSDAQIRVFAGTEGKPLRLMRGHEDAITAMEGVSGVGGPQGGCLVATGSVDKTVRCWDARAKRPQIFSFKGHSDTVTALRWGEGGRTVLSAGKDKSIKIWDTRAGRLRVSLEKHFGTVNALRSIPDGAGEAVNNASFVSAGRDSMINLWTADGDCVGTQPAHRSTVNFLSEVNFNLMYKPSLQGSPVMVSLGGDNHIKLWDLGKRFRIVSSIPIPSTYGSLTKAVWVDQAIVTSSSTGGIQMWTYPVSPSSGGGSSVMNSLDNVSLTDMTSVEGGGGGNSSNSEWTAEDLASHSGACTDLLSTDHFLASSSKTGQIFVWSFRV